MNRFSLLLGRPRSAFLHISFPYTRLITLMQRHREKGMVTMMSKTERAVRMKAVMPGSLSSAASKVKKRGEIN